MPRSFGSLHSVRILFEFCSNLCFSFSTHRHTHTLSHTHARTHTHIPSFASLYLLLISELSVYQSFTSGSRQAPGLQHLLHTHVRNSERTSCMPTMGGKATRVKGGQGGGPAEECKSPVGLFFKCDQGQAPVITHVALGSPAHNAGLLQGDRILSVSATDKLARTNFKGILSDELNGLIRQTFHAAAKAGGKMIIRVERLGGKGVQELDKELVVSSKTASHDTPMDGLKGNNCVFQQHICLCVNVVTMECNCIFYICTFLNHYAF